MKTKTNHHGKRISHSEQRPSRTLSAPHLGDVLAEGRHGDHLAHEVEVRGHQRHDPAAVEHGQAVLVDDRAVLESEQAQHKVSGSITFSLPALKTCRCSGMLAKTCHLIRSYLFF